MSSIPVDDASTTTPRPGPAVVPAPQTATSRQAHAASAAAGDADKRARRQAMKERVATERKVSRQQRAMRRALRGGRRLRRAAVPILLVEQELHGVDRGSESSTFGEVFVRSAGKVDGERVVRRTERTLSRRAARIQRLQKRQQRRRLRADVCFDRTVKHPDGGKRLVREVLEDQTTQRSDIAYEGDQGSLKHRRLPGLLRMVPPFVLCMDALLLLYFFSGVTNVLWTNPWTMSAAFAFVLAAAVTGVSYGSFTLLGESLNRYKADDGDLSLEDVDLVTRITMVLAGAGMAVLALLMFVRIRSEVLQALPGSDGSALIIGLTLAVVSVLANSMVVAVHARDGSEDTRRLDGLGKAVRRPLAKAHRLRLRAARLDPRIEAAQRRSERIAAAGITRASRRVSAADQYVDAARSLHQGVGVLSDAVSDPNLETVPAGYRALEGHPRLDERMVRMTLEQLEEPLSRPGKADTGGADTGTVDTAPAEAAPAEASGLPEVLTPRPRKSTDA